MFDFGIAWYCKKSFIYTKSIFSSFLFFDTWGFIHLV